MFMRFLKITLLAVSFAMAGPVWSYDPALAESYAALFSTVKGAAAGKALHLIPPDVFIGKVKAEEPLVVLDIRTPAETGIYSVTLPGSLRIPMSELFTETGLAQIPADKTVVVLCISGTRAAAYRVRQCLYSERRVQGTCRLHGAKRGKCAIYTASSTTTSTASSTAAGINVVGATISTGLVSCAGTFSGTTSLVISSWRHSPIGMPAVITAGSDKPLYPA